MVASAHRSLNLLTRAIRAYLGLSPFCVSFEVTRRCNARCKHCHLGGRIEESVAPPERYQEICRQVKPLAILISGGEPLLRKDLVDVVTSLHNPGGPPYIAITTNGWLLNYETYEVLRQAGVDRFSISLDYPDERHDEFRNMPGLFNHIRNFIKRLDHNKPKPINISCVVHRHNYRELPKIAELGNQWGVRVNFSTYTPLRTGDTDYMLTKDDLLEFRKIIHILIRMKRHGSNIRTSDYVLNNMVTFFEKGGLAGCRAGRRYFVVNPDGTLSPCGLIIRAYSSWQEVKTDFSSKNACQSCYTSLRADCERPLRYLATDTIDFRM